PPHQSGCGGVDRRPWSLGKSPLPFAASRLRRLRGNNGWTKDSTPMSQDETINAYLAGADTLRRAVAGMSREQLLARPVAGKWSTLEVVGHIANFEPILADRMKRVIAADRPQLLGADENEFAARLAYHDRSLDDELAIITHTRRQLAHILRRLPADAWQRAG